MIARIKAAKVVTDKPYNLDDIPAKTDTPFSLKHYELQRDPDENDEEYARRRSLFE